MDAQLAKISPCQVQLPSIKLEGLGFLCSSVSSLRPLDYIKYISHTLNPFMVYPLQSYVVYPLQSYQTSAEKQRQEEYGGEHTSQMGHTG